LDPENTHNYIRYFELCDRIKETYGSIDRFCEEASYVELDFYAEVLGAYIFEFREEIQKLNSD
jgi:hypothetical protein